MVNVIKRNGSEQKFDANKIKNAIRKSANRVCVTLTDKEEKQVVDSVKNQLKYQEVAVPIDTIHNMVEVALDRVNQDVAKSYREYRDNRKQFSAMLDKVYSKKLSLNFIGDRSNANADSALVTTQKAIVYNELNSELYKKFFLTQREERAVSDGYIYIHDRGSRLDTINCFARETEFVTINGIQSFKEFKDGDKVRVPTHRENWKWATVHSYGKQELFKVTFKREDGQQSSVICTRNHRWILKGDKETTALSVGDELIKVTFVPSFGMGGLEVAPDGWKVESIEETGRKETVWCLDVEEDHSFILKYGIPTGNCCIFDMKNLITGGFFMGNLDYQEPKSLDVAFDLIGDVTLNAAASQYGGFTIPEIDKLFEPYAEKSYQLYLKDYLDIKGVSSIEELSDDDKKLADEFATNKVRREFEQGFQSWEMKFNSVASSRGDYPFTAITFGLGTGKWETMASSSAMKVRKNGQGNEGFKHPVLFPKLSFFYDEELHGEGKELEWLFDEAIACSMKTMYPDFISLSGDGYAPSMYRKYGVAISRMGCLDYTETVYVSDRKWGYSPKSLMIGELFKSLKDGRGFNYINNRVKRIAKHIKDPDDKKKFEERGYIWYDGELMNQWAKDFKEYNGRKPTRGDVKEYFGYELHRKSIRESRKIDSSLFNLWDSYLELKVTDILKNNNFIEVNTIDECTDEMKFVRNKMLRNNDGNVKQIDIFFPKRSLGIEIQDFATHSRIDNEKYSINGHIRDDMVFKKGPSYSNDKKQFFNNLGITLVELWEDSIRSNDMSTLNDVLKTTLNVTNNERKNIVKYIDTTDVEMVDLDGIGIKRYVMDIDGSWVQIHKIIKNKNVSDWLSITLSNNQKLLVTSDHPFITEDGQTIASELFVGQKLFTLDDSLTITSIEKKYRISNSYDVETTTGTFVFSNIQSHNCRAQTSPWFIRGGMEPADENDKPVYEGRFNMGAISLHFSMIAAKAKKEDKDFFDVLKYYLDMVRGIHIRTVEFLSHKKAGINPLGFCQGGFYGGHFHPDEEIGRDFLKPMTISFGVIGLNEASVFVTGKSIHEDNSWAIKVMKYINEYADKYKKEDGILYAVYGTPGESLVATQALQFKKKYGVIKNVSDREYVTNSFHCHVSADITPVEKQNIEYPMFHLCNGGNIGYGRLRSNYNFDAFKAITKRAMNLGFYWGNNQQLNFCEHCGKEFIDADVCPHCGSSSLTRITRMSGYLSYESIRGKTMYSDSKLSEFKERKSM